MWIYARLSTRWIEMWLENSGLPRNTAWARRSDTRYVFWCRKCCELYGLLPINCWSMSRIHSLAYTNTCMVQVMVCRKTRAADCRSEKPLFWLYGRRNDILSDNQRQIRDTRVAERGSRTAETASFLDPDQGRGVRWLPRFEQLVSEWWVWGSHADVYLPWQRDSLSICCELEVNGRLGQAWCPMNSLDECLWRCRYMCERSKVRVLHSFVLPVSLYSSEIWTPTGELKRRENYFGTMSLRRIIGYRWQDHIMFNNLVSRENWAATFHPHGSACQLHFSHLHRFYAFLLLHVAACMFKIGIKSRRLPEQWSEIGRKNNCRKVDAATLCFDVRPYTWRPLLSSHSIYSGLSKTWDGRRNLNWWRMFVSSITV